MLQAMWKKSYLLTYSWKDMYEKRKNSYFNCFIPMATQHYSPEYELKYQLVCTRNKKKNANILTRIIYLKLENVWFFWCVVWTCDF